MQEKYYSFQIEEGVNDRRRETKARLPDRKNGSQLSISSEYFVGETFAHFKITEKIGEGAMGCIFKATDLNLQRTVALKILPLHLCKSEKDRQQFLKEARLLSAIDHPFICTVYDLFETEDGLLFMVMPCYEGITLRRRLEDGIIGVDEALSICKQLASGLCKAHEYDIVHQDVKPDNTILTDGNLIKIIDFGLARLIGKSSDESEKVIMGTIAYMSPEQTFGNPVDARTDIWSLGVVLYEMLTGHLPFRGDFSQAIIHSILNEEPEPMADIAEQLQKIIRKCLAKDANERYQNMKHLLIALEVYQTRERKLAGKQPKDRNNMRQFLSGVAMLM